MSVMPAVVWHGFTQMASYLDNDPVIVEAGEGRELIDVEGRRYLDAISSLWVPRWATGCPSSTRPCATRSIASAHSTLLGNGNRTVVELAEALAAVVPVDVPHFLFVSDGAAAVRQALKIAFQHWANLGVGGRTGYLALGHAYHGDTVGSLSVGAGGFGTDLFDPLRFGGFAGAGGSPVIRAPGYDDPRALQVAAEGWSTSTARGPAAVVLEPLVQGAAGTLVADPRADGPLVAACRRHDVLLICDEVATGFGRTGTLFASEQCGLRPDLMAIGKGLTGGDLRRRPRLRATGSTSRSLARTCRSAPSTTATPTVGTPWPWWSARPRAAHRTSTTCWPTCGPALPRWRGWRGSGSAPLAGVADVRLCGVMAGVELAPPAEGLRWGRRVCAAAVRRGVLLRPLGDVVVLMPPLTVTDDEVERIVDTLAAAIAEARPRCHVPARAPPMPGAPGRDARLGRADRRRADRHPGGRTLAGHA